VLALLSTEFALLRPEVLLTAYNCMFYARISLCDSLPLTLFSFLLLRPIALSSFPHPCLGDLSRTCTPLIHHSTFWLPFPNPLTGQVKGVYCLCLYVWDVRGTICCREQIRLSEGYVWSLWRILILLSCLQANVIWSSSINALNIFLLCLWCN
jgi:hypothetical protein